MKPSATPAQGDLAKPLRELAAAFALHHIQYALVGGLATSYRSQPRFTKDLDFVLEIPQLVLPGLLDELSLRGVYVRVQEVIKEWTQEHMTVLAYQGIRIDWLKPVIPLYSHVLANARFEKWEGGVRIATAEGLILVKLLAFRPQDQLDIETLLGTNQGLLDLDWVREEWQSVHDKDDPRMRWFEKSVEDYYNPH